jgi:hypothetical protein
LSASITSYIAWSGKVLRVDVHEVALKDYGAGWEEGYVKLGVTVHAFYQAW